MGTKRERFKRYPVHGVGVDSLHRGFDEVQMPEGRRAVACEVVDEVLAANGADAFYWYKPPRTPELACYWDDVGQNVLWITAGEVHTWGDDTVTRPDRPVTWSKTGGRYVGWLLPGAEAGSGGGEKKPTPIRTVMCPETFVRQPVGSTCPECELVH